MLISKDEEEEKGRVSDVIGAKDDAGRRTDVGGQEAGEAEGGVVLRSVVKAGREVWLGHSRAGVDAVCFCVFSSGVVVCDEKMRLRVGAITHQERRSVRSAEGLVKDLGKPWLLKRTGNL